MKSGTQIAHIPNHANGDIHHPDVEFGFVVSENKDKTAHFCRYWYKNYPTVLRIRANSELTPNENLVKYESHSQTEINDLIEMFKPPTLDLTF
jgi:hypothetical protein